MYKALARFAQNNAQIAYLESVHNSASNQQATCSRQFSTGSRPSFAHSSSHQETFLTKYSEHLLPKYLSPVRAPTTSRSLEALNFPSTTTMLSALQNPRQAAAQLLNFALILSTAFMMWKGISVIADSPSPIVVVLSGSMEPAFQRGDLLFLWNRNVLEETKVGEIVVYNVKGKDIPIVHRVVRKFGLG